MAGLSAAQLARFNEDGYLVVEGVLAPRRDIEPLLGEYAQVLDGIAESFHADGVLAATYRELPFTERLIQVCKESGRSVSQHFDISLPQTGVLPTTPIHLGPATFSLLTSPRLLDVVESIVGPEIYSNPVQHIRMKLPPHAVTNKSSDGLSTSVPWHQDNGVILPEADEATILTVWMPLNDATLENGCLRVVPRSHRGDLIPHCPGPKGASIPDTLVRVGEALPVPLRAGSLLLLNQRIVHSSLDNVTRDQVRISLDLRYQPIGQPTGRPAFPGFVARSAAHPETVLRDPANWARLWLDTRARLSEQETPSFNRWQAGVGFCA